MKKANDGTAFFYFETGKRPVNNAKFLSDYDIANIVEINELGLDVSIITLPVDWCRICGRISNRYRCVFDLRYFQQFTEKERKAVYQSLLVQGLSEEKLPVREDVQREIQKRGNEYGQNEKTQTE